MRNMTKHRKNSDNDQSHTACGHRPTSPRYSYCARPAYRRAAEILIEQIDVEFQMVAETTITGEVGAEGKTGSILSFFLADASASAKASGERNWGHIHTVKIRMSIDGEKSDRTVGSTGTTDQ